MAMNARQLPAMVADSGAQQYQYQYDPNGNVSAILDQTRGNAYSRTMEYDARDRLRVAASASFGGTGAHRYTYDAQDNLRTHVTGDTSYEYYYDGANRLTNLMNVATGASVVGLSYDVQGNLSNKNGQAYTFSQGNRLRSAANKEWYAYDGYGRRVIACGSAACNYQLYSQLGQLLYTQDARKGINTDYIYLAGSVVALRARAAAGGAESVTYQHTDALGSPVATTNAAGQVVERTQYEPYGAAIGKTVDGVGYAGHAMDGGTGLIYVQQRYYDPVVGRFLSVDPVAASSGPGFNRYSYANNNPYRFYDPDGRCTGSRIANDDGTCKSTGEFTTQAGSARSLDARTVDKVFSHSSVSTLGGEAKPSSFPKETRSALGKFLGSSVGGAIGREAVGTGQKIELEQILPSSGYPPAFSCGYADTNVITYSLQWKQYLSSNKFGREFAGAGLDVLLAHEIGHLPIAGSVFGYSPITSSSNADEFNAVRYLENPYRHYLGLPLRTHYSGIPVPDPLMSGGE